MIISIATQFNLLALSAAMELTEAGETGRGFARMATAAAGLAHYQAVAVERMTGEIDALRAEPEETSTTLNAIAAMIDAARSFVKVVAMVGEELKAGTA